MWAMSDVSRTGALCYEAYKRTLDKDDGSIPVCVPLVDEDGDSAVLTSSYKLSAFNRADDFNQLSPLANLKLLINLMDMSRTTIREHGGIPLEEAPPR